MNTRLTALIVGLAMAALTAYAAKSDTIKVASQYLDTPLDVQVIVPTTGDADTHYPTVYLLNGYGGDHTSWTTIRPNLPDLADQYGMVIVMPDGRDSWYWDAPNNPGMQMESFITRTLVPYIDANYPTKPDAAHRAIMGLSMGGHGGLWLGMRHSDIWGNAGSTSGGVNIMPFTGRWKMKNALGEYSNKNHDLWASHTVINLVPSLTPGQLNIIFDCGVDDFFAGVNNDLHKALLDAKIPHDYISRPGNHSQQYWKNSVIYQLLYFNEAFAKADAAQAQK